jgi:diketogulonate reductase-like aldo/keto reductase
MNRTNNSTTNSKTHNNANNSTLGADHDYLSEFLSHTSRNKVTTPAQVLLRWSLQNQFITLTQSVDRERLLENYNALVMSPLTFREMTLLDAIQHLVGSPLNVPVYV